MAYDVFISYSNKDRLIANRLCHKLEEEHIRCWIAPRDISPGGSWAGEIAEAIQNVNIMILIFSSYSNSSKQVLREVELAINHDIILIPLRIEDINPTGSMSYFLSTTHWIDWTDDSFVDKYSLLRNRIKSIVEPKEADHQDTPDKPEFSTQRSQDAQKPVSRRNQSLMQWLSHNKRKRLLPYVSIFIIVLTSVVLFAVFDGSRLLAQIKGQTTIGNTPGDSQSNELTSLTTSDSTTTTTQTTAPTSESSQTSATETTTIINTRPDIIYVDGLRIYKPEDYGLDPDQVITIADDKLDLAIHTTLQKTGKPAADDLTIMDMFQLTALIIVSDEQIHFIHEYDEQSQHMIVMGDEIQNLDGLQYALNMITLHIYGNDLNDISALSELENLTMLKLYACNITDIRALIDLNQLEYLNLSGNKGLKDVSALIHTDSLKTLCLGNIDFPSSQVSSLYGLTDIISLTDLKINENGIKYLNGLEKLVNLEKLDLSGNPAITDIQVLRDMTDLKYLSLCGIPFASISSINGLSDLVFLKELELNDNGLKDVSGLASFVNLEYLTLNWNPINDIRAFSTLSRLQALHINSIGQFQSVSEIQGLTNLTFLQELSIDGNSLRNIDGLAALDKLLFLNISDNNISDISVLANFKRLNQLILDSSTFINNRETIKQILKYSTQIDIR